MFPKSKLIIYDLGLRPVQQRYFAGLCGVSLRPFHFHKYIPEGDMDSEALAACRWKPIVIAEVLGEAASLWWMDTSLRWEEGAAAILSSSVYPGVGDGSLSPYLMADASDHSIHAVTHSYMYEYLPIEMEERTKALVMGAAFALIVRSPLVQELIKWYVLCALAADCMSPRGITRYCDVKPGEEGRVEWAHCHRYDQSAINILLANHFRADYRKYVNQGERFGFVDRHPAILKTWPPICNATLDPNQHRLLFLIHDRFARKVRQ